MKMRIQVRELDLHNMLRDLVTQEMSDVSTSLKIIRNNNAPSLSSVIAHILAEDYRAVKREGNERYIDINDSLLLKIGVENDDLPYPSRYRGGLYEFINDSVNNYFISSRSVDLISPAIEEDCDYYNEVILEVIDYIIDRIESTIFMAITSNKHPSIDPYKIDIIPNQYEGNHWFDIILGVGDEGQVHHIQR